jgi:zinc transporter ZupT
MGLTVQLALRIAIVWAAGFLIAVVVRALLPEAAGITLTGKQSTLMVSFSRIGFWTCLLAALTVTGLVVVRAMLADIGWNSLR